MFPREGFDRRWPIAYFPSAKCGLKEGGGGGHRDSRGRTWVAENGTFQTNVRGKKTLDSPYNVPVPLELAATDTEPVMEIWGCRKKAMLYF